MNRIPIFILSWLPLFLMTGLQAQEELQAQQVLLRYELKQEEEYSLELNLQQNTFGEGQEGARITLSTRTGLWVRVDSVRQRSYLLTASYCDLELSMSSGSLGIDISSQEDPKSMLSSMISKLEEGTFILEIASNGRILGIHGLAALLDSIHASDPGNTQEELVVRETLREAFGKESLTGHLSLFLGFYPTFPEMRKWTTDQTCYFNTRPVVVNNSLQLGKINENSMVIQGLGMLRSNEAYVENGDMGKVESVAQGSQTYDLTVDRQSGWPLKGLSRQRVRIETTIIESSMLPPGLKIPSYTESLYEIEGRVVNLQDQ